MYQKQRRRNEEESEGKHLEGTWKWVHGWYMEWKVGEVTNIANRLESGWGKLREGTAKWGQDFKIDKP